MIARSFALWAAYWTAAIGAAFIVSLSVQGLLSPQGNTAAEVTGGAISIALTSAAIWFSYRVSGRISGTGRGGR